MRPQFLPPNHHNQSDHSSCIPNHYNQPDHSSFSQTIITNQTTDSSPNDFIPRHTTVLLKLLESYLILFSTSFLFLSYSDCADLLVLLFWQNFMKHCLAPTAWCWNSSNIIHVMISKVSRKKTSNCSQTEAPEQIHNTHRWCTTLYLILDILLKRKLLQGDES